MIHLVNGTPQSHRVKRLQIQASIFLHLLRNDGTRLLKSEGIPEDAGAVAFSFDGYGLNVITIYIESAEFPEVQEGDQPGIQDAIFTEYYPEIVEPDKLLFTVGEENVAGWKQRLEKQIAKMEALARRETASNATADG